MTVRDTSLNFRRVCILGGTGFMGRYLVEHLGRCGYSIRVPSRRPERHRDLATNPMVELRRSDIHDDQQLAGQLQDVDVVINLVGLLNTGSGRENSFDACHVELPRRVNEAARRNGVRRLLHMSALNANAGLPRGEYLRSKGQGEDIAHQAANAGLLVTSFRPSVIFGPGDSFFNRFHSLLKTVPVLFPLACADTRFAPVYAGDVASAITASIGNRQTIGKRYDLCGPHVYTLARLVRYTAKVGGLRRLIIPLPDLLARAQAHVLQHFPGRPFTMDNYYSLQHDSVCEQNSWPEFSIAPTSIEAIVPGYLKNHSARGRYHGYRTAAGRN